VIGQEHVTVTLENAIKSDRLASAYLLSGPRGVGKTSTARILAKALNCETGPTTTPCNDCTACKEIAQGNNIDVLEIDGASNRGIDEVRNLRESTRYTPAKSRYKIYIVDEVHMLTNEAFNALLKTLEEPPPHVVFIFATTEINKVPATILSRCQRFDFKRISNQKIVQLLKTICEHDNIKIEDSALHLIAKKADGSMRDGESLLDQVVSFCGMDVAEKNVAELLGMVQQELFIEIGEAILKKNLKTIIEISQRVYEHGQDTNSLMLGLNEYFNNLLKLKVTDSTDHLLGLEGYYAQYQEHAKAFSEIDLIRSMQVVAEAAAAMKRSMNPQLQLENTLLRLAEMSPAVHLEQLLTGIETLKKKTVIGDAPGAIEQPKPQLTLIPEIDPARVSGGLFARLNNNQNNQETAKAGIGEQTEQDRGIEVTHAGITLEEIKTSWPKIVAAIKTKKIAMGSFLQEGEPVRVNGNRIDVVFKETNGFNAASLNEQRRFIQEVIREIIGKRVVLNCLSGKTPNKEMQNGIEKKENGLQEPGIASDRGSENTVSGFPVAQKLIDSLDGELIR
ncbi:MAG: DNA polymerase III subunit gamma/tau, partial [bacterium]